MLNSSAPLWQPLLDDNKMMLALFYILKVLSRFFETTHLIVEKALLSNCNTIDESTY